MKEGEGATSDTRARSRLRAALVGAQMAFTTVLVIATTLFGRAIASIHAVQPEWNLDGVLVSAVDLEVNGTTAAGAHAFRHDVRQRIASMPGVDAVAFAAKLPIGGRSSFGDVYAVGSDPATTNGLNASVSRVSPDYLRAMRIPLRAGRDFTDADAPNAPLVAIVNETMAGRLWGSNDTVVGKAFFVGRGDYRREFTVVGVAGASRLRLPGDPPEAQYYVPLDQAYTSSVVLHVRAPSPGAAASLAAPVRAIVRQLMPTLPIPPLRPITEALDVYLLPQRVAAWVGATMGVFGLILAAVGVYGVTAFAISRRRREIAIRLALGGTARDVTRIAMADPVRRILRRPAMIVLREE